MRAATNDAYGYLVFSRLGFEGGTVFVNRGFVPESSADAVLADSGAQEGQITGFIRKSEKPGWLASEPDPDKKIFLFADIAAMAQSLSLDPARIITSEYIEADAASSGAGWPKGRDPKDLLAAIPNNHLEYALTSFGLAAALAGIFGFRLLQNLRRGSRS
jgi:surfeit locus 1 family protein